MSTASDVTSQICIVYSKLFLIVCLCLINIYIYKIVHRLTKGDSLTSLYAVVLCSGALELFDSVAYTGQDEIVYLSFLVMALYFAMANKKVISILLATVSVTVCPIMIIPYFFVVAIYEEKILVTVVKMLLTLSPTILFEVIYRNDAIYSSLKGLNTLGIFQMMMNTATIPSTVGPVSIGALVMAVLGFWCLFVKDDKDKDRKCIVVLAIVFVFMSFFMDSHFYRSCLYIPFIVMLVCMEEEWISYKILFVFLMGISRFLFFLGRHIEYNLSPRFLAGLVARHFSNLPEQIINPYSIGFDTSFYFFRVFALAAVIMLFALHFFRGKINLRTFLPKSVMIIIYSFQNLILVAFFFWAIS